MNIRIVAGLFGGRTIKTPKSQATHPMSERIRGAIFNIIGKKILNASVLDAFAGTGAIGLEAVSRGAKSALFIEKDRVAFSILKKNIEVLGVQPQATATQIGVNAWIEGNKEKKFDIIFADPPFNDPQLSTAMKLLGMLKSDGLMLLSCVGSGEVPTVDGFVVVDNRMYGKAALIIYRRER